MRDRARLARSEGRGAMIAWACDANGSPVPDDVVIRRYRRTSTGETARLVERAIGQLVLELDGAQPESFVLRSRASADLAMRGMGYFEDFEGPR